MDYPKSDCNLPIAHQAIVHQQAFNNQAIPQGGEAQITRKFQNRQSQGSDTGAINQLNSRLENINPGYNSLRVLNFINQTQPKMQQYFSHNFGVDLLFWGGRGNAKVEYFSNGNHLF